MSREEGQREREREKQTLYSEQGASHRAGSQDLGIMI